MQTRFSRWRIRASAAGIALASLVVFAQALAQTDSRPRIDTSGINAQPAYPASALALREKGTAVLDVVVTSDGQPVRALLSKTSGFNDLDEAAINAVLGWRYVPARQNGGPAEGVASVAVGFQPPPSNDPSVQDTVKVSSNYLPDVFEPEMGSGERRVESRQIPCKKGMFRATLLYIRGLTMRNDSELPGVLLDVKTDSEMARLKLVGFGVDTLPNYIIFERRNIATEAHNSAETDFENRQFEPLMPQSTDIPAELAWDESGLVTATIAQNFGESHRIKLNAAPTMLEFGILSASAKIIKPELICSK